MTTRHILIAEDSPTQAAVLRSHLESAGYRVSVAANGTEALASAAEAVPDLIVSDIVMPDVDGYELCRRAKERHPSVPVVLLTSMNDPLDVVHALEAGADNFLRKPYEPTELIHRVGNMLHNKHLRETGRAQMGLELYFLGRRFMITADREQILDLLMSTFEDLVTVNRQLTIREEELATARDELAVRLAETERERSWLDAVLSAVPGGMAVLDREGRLVHSNDELAEMTGVPCNELNGAMVSDVIRLVDHDGAVLPVEARTVNRSLRGDHGAVLGSSFDLFLERPDGERVPVVARSEPVRGPDDTVVGAVGTIADLRTVLEHDPVTRLPGQRLLVDRVANAAELAVEHRKEAGVAMLVIDRFSHFRERLSPEAIDSVVSTIASRLRNALSSRDIRHRAPAASAASLSNGEFAVLLPDLDNEHDAMAVTQLLTDCLTGTVHAEGIDLAVTVSAALGMCSEQRDVPALLATIVTAAREVSRGGGGRVASMNRHRTEHVVAALQREAELREALEQDQLVVYYQPQVSIRDELPSAVEALVRWDHPERGILGAGEVIPLAIEAGLISPISWYVLEAACRQAAAWHRSMPDGTAPMLSVNLDVEQLTDPLAAGRIADVLAASGLDPTMLTLEITEASVMRDPVLASERLRLIKTLGCRIAVDDFGTGYSSLLQLRHLPVDVLKIDRVFVDGMLEEPADAAIVSTVIRLARSLGLEVVAEGVETRDQLLELLVLGCDVGQGFYWARPMPPDALLDWWSTRSAAERPAKPTDLGLADGDRHHDELIASLAYDLRVPLDPINEFTKLLQAVPNDQSLEFIEAIRATLGNWSTAPSA